MCLVKLESLKDERWILIFNSWFGCHLWCFEYLDKFVLGIQTYWYNWKGARGARVCLIMIPDHFKLICSCSYWCVAPAKMVRMCDVAPAKIGWASTRMEVMVSGRICDVLGADAMSASAMVFHRCSLAFVKRCHTYGVWLAAGKLTEASLGP